MGQVAYNHTEFTIKINRMLSQLQIIRKDLQC
jgi:hypothetical protein